ncbi:MAG TPA: hypothetical protein V6C63_07640 [Allocoleopsis sp.]
MLTLEQLQQFRRFNQIRSIGAEDEDAVETINVLLDEVERLWREREDLKLLVDNILPTVNQVELQVQAQARRIHELEVLESQVKTFIYSVTEQCSSFKL